MSRISLFKNPFLSVCLLLLMALPGCASPEAVSKMTEGKTIAVTSTVKDDFDLTWIGTTVFHNEYGKIEGWEINKNVVDAAVKDLQNSGRFRNVFSVAAKDTDKGKETQKNADFVVRIMPLSAHMAEYVKGIGVLRRTMFGGEGSTFGHVVLYISILDAESGIVRDGPVKTIWDTPFKLESGPKVPEGELQNLRTETNKKIQETVHKFFKESGLVK